jgi:hypothetical protein
MVADRVTRTEAERLLGSGHWIYLEALQSIYEPKVRELVASWLPREGVTLDQQRRLLDQLTIV